MRPFGLGVTCCFPPHCRWSVVGRSSSNRKFLAGGHRLLGAHLRRPSLWLFSRRPASCAYLPLSLGRIHSGSCHPGNPGHAGGVLHPVALLVGQPHPHPRCGIRPDGAACHLGQSGRGAALHRWAASGAGPGLPLLPVENRASDLFAFPPVPLHQRSAHLHGAGLEVRVAAEVICPPKLAIGTEISQARTALETPELFAWTLVIIALSLLLEGLVRRLLMGRGNTL